MPQSLHAELARAAEREEVSLNQFITNSLAAAVGWRQPKAEPTPAALTPAAPTPAALAAAQPPNAEAEPTPAALAGARPPNAEAEPEAPSARPERANGPPRWLRAALVTNVIVVALAAIVAVVLLLVAWQQGF